MEPIEDWKQLEPGMHVQLSCKCQGIVVSVHRDPSEDNRDTGFFVAYTTGLGCGGESLEDTYRRGYGPYVNFFNYSLSTEAMPAIETPLPEWWGENPRLVAWMQERRARVAAT